MIRRWWLRRIFYVRQQSATFIAFFVFCLLFTLIFVPNPFASRYKAIPLNQNVNWENVENLLDLKDQLIINEPVSERIKLIDLSNEQAPLTSGTILIVLYTTVFHEKKFCSWTAERLFGASCPVKDLCQWSCDEKRIFEADAIIFHAFDIIRYRLTAPDRSKMKRTTVWILWSDEPPSIIDYQRLNSFQFNWTMSYRLQSEVSIGTYGLFSKRDEVMNDETFDQWIEKEFSRRTDGALWFVSNCNAKKRLKIYSELKDFTRMNIEGYGHCVDSYPLHLCRSYSQCELDYTSKFKFYFSFESNTCRDYITEKFYKAFHYKMIPIVLGPSKENYDKFAPKQSFIHIDQFQDDLPALAKYLDEIHVNRSLFASFHQWRKSFDVIVEGRALERIRICELCWRLTQIRHDETTTYTDLPKFYSDQCKSQ